VPTCPYCREPSPDGFRVCPYCGTPLTAIAPGGDIRKTVTIVVSDLKGSTSLAERLDSETLREVLRTYFEAMQRVVTRHGGSVEKYIGDAIVAVFGVPRLHEDDAVRAVRAALEMCAELERVNERLEPRYGVRLENRTGVNTGDVVVGEITVGQRLVSGDAVNVAARFEQAAPANQVLIGDSTYRLVKDAVDVQPVEPKELKGKSERIPAYLLLSVRATEGVARRMNAPMVGRTHELAVLQEALSRARERSACEVVTVLGPAGTGKSRLLWEFVDASPEARSVRGRCLSYGDGITFWPLAEIARSAAGIANDDSLERANAKLGALFGDTEADVADRVAGAIGLGVSAYPVEEIFWAARRLFERLAAGGALIVVIDDLHWAEPTFLHMIRLVARTAERPIVFACSARRDLLDDYPDWEEKAPGWQTVALQPLSDEDSGQVVANLLGTTDVDDRIKETIVTAAEGNPLFVEQLLSMLIDDRLLACDERGRWVLMGDAEGITVPGTIRAVLSARLDKLNAADRIVIERAAVVGRIFFRGAVEELSPEDVRPKVDDSLKNLIAKELIRPYDESALAGQDTYGFMHGLIQDAAYHSVLKRTRAELHVQLVDWFEGALLPDRVMEFEEIIGHHLEEAYLTLTQIAKPDERAIEIGVRGSSHLSAAGRRALARGDVPAAAILLRRATALLQTDDPARPQLVLEAAEAMIEQGRFAESDALIVSAIDEARALGDTGLEFAGRVLQLELRYTTDPESVHATLDADVKLLLPKLESLGRLDALARGWRLRMLIAEMKLHFRDAEAAAERTLDYARRAGNRMMEGRAIPSLGMCALQGPTPVPKAIARCRQLLDDAKGDRKAEALLLAAISHLEAMRGNFDEARALYQRSRAVLEELGWTFLAAQTSFDSGPVELLASDPAAAESELRRDYETLIAMGERNYISTTAALLAHAVLQQGRLDNAYEFSVLSEGFAAPDDRMSQTLWRTARAQVLARRGDPAAEPLVREAIDIIEQAESPEACGNAYVALGEVLVNAGRPQAAAGAFRDAARCFGEKGIIVSERQALRRLEELGQSVVI
jgi:class 3 adenylate cyclase/tetratricopeptide (TPR) repeat protein